MLLFQARQISRWGSKQTLTNTCAQPFSLAVAEEEFAKVVSEIGQRQIAQSSPCSASAAAASSDGVALLMGEKM